jgi:GH18 family chitinase
MRAVVLLAVLLSACISEKGAEAPSSSPSSGASSASGTTEASAPSAAAVAINTGPKKVVGYFANWTQYHKGDCKFTAADVDPSLLTHLNFAFAKVDPGPGGKAKPKFGLAAYDEKDLGPNGQYAQVQALKKKNPSLKTALSIGGWSHNEGDMAWLFTTMAEKPETRADFIKATIAYVRLHGFDGVDLDWEYPADPTRGGRSVDTNNFTALLNEFRAGIDAEAKATGKEALTLTIAAPAGVALRGLDLTKVSQPLDWINLMSYDYEGGWSKVTGHNAPAPFRGPGVQGSVSIYMNFGVPAEKIVLGMATYGRSFASAESAKVGAPANGNGPKGRCTDAPGMLAYFEIKELIDAGKLKTSWDDSALVPYGYDPTSKLWVSYDDEKSFSKKMDFIDQKGLGGAMFWALDMDDFHHGFPLVASVAKRYKK